MQTKPLGFYNTSQPQKHKKINSTQSASKLKATYQFQHHKPKRTNSNQQKYQNPIPKQKRRLSQEGLDKTEVELVPERGLMGGVSILSRKVDYTDSDFM